MDWPLSTSLTSFPPTSLELEVPKTIKICGSTKHHSIICTCYFLFLKLYGIFKTQLWSHFFYRDFCDSFKAVITCLSTSILVPNGSHCNYLLTYQPPPLYEDLKCRLMSFPLDNPTLGTEFNEQKRLVCLEALPRKLGGQLEREEGNWGKSSCLLSLSRWSSLFLP